MRSWMNRSLISVLVLFSGCASVKTVVPSTSFNPCIQKFVPKFRSQWYRSTIDVRGRHFSGLFLFKIMPDSSMRVVFTNETGLTIFDYEFRKNGDFRVVETIKPLRRNVVTNVLRKDIELITLMNVPTTRFNINDDCSRLISTERIEKGKVKALANFFADSISVTHVDFDMELKLHSLKKE
jgi:hypothetical protein